MVTRPPAGTIPESPGSYQFKDALGRVIYVGKASSLRQRLSNYFQDPRNLHPRTAQMVATAETVEWIEVRNEVEALMLEYSLIKLHRPRFNIRLRDDKSYPFLAVTMDEQFPRALVMRGRKRKGTRYFGPYAHAYAIRETLDLLLRSFPVRTCSPGKFNEHQRLGRPCLLFHIEKCSGPCVGEIDEMPYRQLVHELCEFLDGDTDDILKRLEAEMKQAASELEYERAARLRDRLVSVQRAVEKQQMVADRNEDIDVIGLADDELEAAVQVFFVRKGRVVGRKGFILDKVEDLSPGGLIDRIMEEMYGDEPPAGVPKQVLVPVDSEDLAIYEEWLTHLRGSKVQIRVPQRGDKRDLHETVTRNAREEFVRHRLRRAGDHNARSRALTEIQDLLGLPEAPLRIECYDMAHLQGTDYVGSMVVLEDGLPNKREYRRFKVKEVPGNDDYAAMEEVLTRRLKAYLDERDAPIGERGAKPGKFAYPPQLLLVDGGKGQLGVAERVVQSLGLADEIPIASLAKRFEEVYLPGRSEPVEVPRGSEALFMLQRIRDEAHRFANGFHRELRGKRMTVSSLDGISGLGEARRKKLVQALGGVNKVKQASLDTLKDLSFLPDAVAEAIYAKFHPSTDDDPGARSAAGPDVGAAAGSDGGSGAGSGIAELASHERAEHLITESLVGGEALLGSGAEGEVGDGELVDPGLDVGPDEVDQFSRPSDQ
jgi:excinuclease ABC subunit C